MNYNNQTSDDCRHYSLTDATPGLVLASNFTLGEFRCHDGNDTVIIHPECISLVQRTRDYFGAVVHINSAYRTPKHNKLVGGRPASRHVLGLAVDVVVVGVAPAVVASYWEALGVGGVGRYDTFTHGDVWSEHRRWDNSTPPDQTP